MLAFQLRQCSEPVVFGFEGEADDPPLEPLSAASVATTSSVSTSLSCKRFACLGDLAGFGNPDQDDSRKAPRRRSGRRNLPEGFAGGVEHFLGRDDGHDHRRPADRRPPPGPETTTTSCPSSSCAAASPSAAPIRPLEAFVRYRTGSRCWRVGPEVMRMRAIG